MKALYEFLVKNKVSKTEGGLEGDLYKSVIGYIKNGILDSTPKSQMTYNNPAFEMRTGSVGIRIYRTGVQVIGTSRYKDIITGNKKDEYNKIIEGLIDGYFGDSETMASPVLISVHCHSENNRQLREDIYNMTDDPGEQTVKSGYRLNATVKFSSRNGIYRFLNRFIRNWN